MTSARFAKRNGRGREGERADQQPRGAKQNRALVTATWDSNPTSKLQSESSKMPEIPPGYERRQGQAGIELGDCGIWYAFSFRGFALLRRRSKG